MNHELTRTCTNGRAPHEHAADPARLGMIFAAVEAGCGLRVCAWCKAWLGLARDLEAGKVTDGVCDRCEAKLMEELAALAVDLPPVAGESNLAKEGPGVINPCRPPAISLPATGAESARASRSAAEVLFLAEDGFKPEVICV